MRRPTGSRTQVLSMSCSVGSTCSIHSGPMVHVQHVKKVRGAAPRAGTFQSIDTNDHRGSASVSARYKLGLDVPLQANKHMIITSTCTWVYAYIYAHACINIYYFILSYPILYYIILHYIVLYYTILYYIILYYTILYYIILYYIYYIILYYTILYYILYYNMLYIILYIVLYIILYYILYYIMLHYIFFIIYYIIWYDIILYYTWYTMNLWSLPIMWSECMTHTHVYIYTYCYSPHGWVYLLRLRLASQRSSLAYWTEVHAVDRCSSTCAKTPASALAKRCFSRTRWRSCASFGGEFISVVSLKNKLDALLGVFWVNCATLAAFFKITLELKPAFQ